jgi:PAS domain S-box-containing protein
MFDIQMNRIKQWWNKFNPFDIPALMHDIHVKVSDLHACNLATSEEYTALREALSVEKSLRIKEKNLTVAILNHLEDMIWAKDLQGEYIMANDAFRNKFCYGLSWKEIKGKNDVQLAKIFKAKVGNENHTFGEVCANSDVIIHETQEAREFLEHGKINGKMVRLVVNKSPVYNFKGEFFATCGSGRDITEWYDSLSQAIESSNACFGNECRELIKKELNKLEFINEDV